MYKADRSKVGITATFVGAAKKLNDVCDALKLAPTTITSVCTQLKLTSAALAQIQHLLLEDTDILENKPAVRDAFETALTSCLVSSTWLEKIMQKITKGLLDVQKESWKTKFWSFWNENDIKELSGQLQKQHVAVGVVVGLLQM